METLDNILKEAVQVWLAMEIPPSQGTVPLTLVGFTQSTGLQYINDFDSQAVIQEDFQETFQL